MNLETIIFQVQKYNSWTQEYSIKVANEYVKFMFLRSKNSKLSPSNDIDKFWHQHILNTKHYYDFCIEKFKKFIHHDPEDSSDQEKRIKRLDETTEIYKKLYNSNPPANVWNSNYAENDKKDQNDQTKEFLTIKLINTFDVYQNGKYVGKDVRINSGYKFDGKIYKVKKTGSLKNLSMKLSEITKHPEMAIKFYKKYSDYQNRDIGYIDKRIPLDKFDDLIVILEEMTSNGYC
jgi:hypothetical protein